MGDNGKKKTGRFVSTAVLIAVMLVIFGSPVFILKPHKKAPFDRDPIYKLRQVRPKYVFLGNSMLGTRIKKLYMEELLGGTSVYLFDHSQKYTAHWYLQLKNYLVRSHVKTKAVFIFFRDNNITNPENHTTGNGLMDLERLSMKDEPVVRQVLFDKEDSTAVEKLLAWIGGLYDTLGYRVNIESVISGMTLMHVSSDSLKKSLNESLPAYFNLDYKPKMVLENGKFKNTVNLIFDYRNLRHERLVEDAPQDRREQMEKDYDFQERNRHSFLPHIIELGKEYDLNLVFIRVQKRPQRHYREPWVKQRYYHDLESYIEENGFIYYDFNGDKKLPFKVYRDSVGHISTEYFEYYTELFVQRLSFIFDEYKAPEKKGAKNKKVKNNKKKK